MIVKRPEVSYNTIAEQIKRGVNSLTIVEWNFIINSLRVQANVNADQIKYIHSVLFGLEDVSLNSDGVALIPELYDKIYNGVIDRAASDGNGNNIINTYATKTELADLLELIVNETIINRAKHDQHGNVIDETYARVADVENGTIIAGKALADIDGATIKTTYGHTMTLTVSGASITWKLFNKVGGLLSTGSITIPDATAVSPGVLTVAQHAALYDKYTKTEMNNMLQRANLVSIIGNVSESLDGLMSAQDKLNLNTLTNLLATNQDGFINTLSEILEIFSGYPEGVDVAYKFSLKADKTEVPILDEYGYIPDVYFADTLIDGGLFTSDLHVNDIDGGSF